MSRARRPGAGPPPPASPGSAGSSRVRTLAQFLHAWTADFPFAPVVPRVPEELPLTHPYVVAVTTVAPDRRTVQGALSFHHQLADAAAALDQALHDRPADAPARLGQILSLDRGETLLERLEPETVTRLHDVLAWTPPPPSLAVRRRRQQHLARIFTAAEQHSGFRGPRPAYPPEAPRFMAFLAVLGRTREWRDVAVAFGRTSAEIEDQLGRALDRFGPNDAYVGTLWELDAPTPVQHYARRDPTDAE